MKRGEGGEGGRRKWSRNMITIILLVLLLLTLLVTSNVTKPSQIKCMENANNINRKTTKGIHSWSQDKHDYNYGYKWGTTRKKNNALMHAVNGNKRAGLKIAHWNMGSADLQNKMRELEHAI